MAVWLILGGQDTIAGQQQIPLDLLAAAILALAIPIFTLTPLASISALRIPLGLAMVLFIPGYCLIAALFPKKDDLDGIERLALSFGLSIAIVPLIGLGLNYTPWGIRLTPVTISLAIFVLIMAAAAYYRRRMLPAEERYSINILMNLETLKSEFSAADKTRLDRALTLLLIFSILISLVALVYVIVTPKQGERFTEFYILGPEGKAYDYPTSVLAGNQSMVIVGVVNHEYARVNYSLAMSLDNAIFLQRDLTLDHNQTWEVPIRYTLYKTGDSQKLEFLLYKESNFTAPYRDLHLWVNVTRQNNSVADIR